MSFKMKSSSGEGGQFEIPPAGNHPAVLVGIIDLGTRPSTFQGKTTDRREVYLVWELTAEKKAGGSTNHTIARAYTLSLNAKANLAKLIGQWRGKALAEGEEFDLLRLLGKPCLLNVTHKPSGDRTFAEVGGASPAPKGLTVPPATIKPVSWDVEDGTDVPDLEWVPFFYGHSAKDEIEQSYEYKARYDKEPATAGAAVGDAAEFGEEDADDPAIPF